VRQIDGITRQINIGGFAIPIRGASSRGITESQERQPPLKASNRRSEERGILLRNKYNEPKYLSLIFIFLFLNS
jgi:hypothetical protein